MKKEVVKNKTGVLVAGGFDELDNGAVILFLESQAGETAFVGVGFEKEPVNKVVEVKKKKSEGKTGEKEDKFVVTDVVEIPDRRSNGKNSDGRRQMKL